MNESNRVEKKRGWGLTISYSCCNYWRWVSIIAAFVQSGNRRGFISIAPDRVCDFFNFAKRVDHCFLVSCMAMEKMGLFWLYCLGDYQRDYHSGSRMGAAC